MQLKFKNPPINELVIGIFFNPPLSTMRSEHVGHFWSLIRENFPNTSHNIPIGGIEIMGPGEIFPMPRFWFASQDETMLMQVQKNAFFINWRKRDSNYPHFEIVKSEFDNYYAKFNTFLKQIINNDELYIDKCELTYINLVNQSDFYNGIRDIKKIIPSFCLLNSEIYDTKDVLCRVVYEPKKNITLNVTVQNRLTNDDKKENLLYYEIKALGKPMATSKSEADAWFNDAHETIGKTFLSMTSREAQKLWE